MSLFSHERRLRRLERKYSVRDEEGPTLEKLVQESYRHEAVEKLTALAQDLANPLPSGPTIEWGVAPAPSVPAVEDGTPIVAPSDPPLPREPRQVWTKTRRPGPHDVLTWEEAMRVPWIEGDEEEDQR